MSGGSVEVKTGEQAELPELQLGADMADLAKVAAAADASLSGAPVVDKATQQAAAAEQAENEAQQLTGMLVMAVKVIGRALPSVAGAYTPQACEAIVGEYLTCAEHYGWTWHRNVASSPAIGLAAAVALPGFMAWPQIRADVARMRGEKVPQLVDESASRNGDQAANVVQLQPQQTSNDGRVL